MKEGVVTDYQTALADVVPPLLEKWQVPGVAIGIHHGDVRVATGFGTTNLEHPLPVDADTIFQVGSISKTTLGLIIGRLVERGQVSLDTPVATLLPDVENLDQRITIKHVITHTSGIDAQNMIGDAPRILADAPDDAIQSSYQHFLDQPLRFAPGSEFSYSGPGIMVAAGVVEAVTGRRYGDVLREEVFGPASLTHTFTTADEAITHRVAAPHGLDTDGRAELQRDQGWQRHWQLPGWDVPGGGVLSTANDLMRYADYVMSAKAPANLFQPLANRGVPGEDISLAWHLGSLAGRPVRSHDGLTIGYATRLVLMLTENLAYTVLTNSVDAGPAVRDIERAILQVVLGVDSRPIPKPDTSVDLDALVGAYDCGFYGTTHLERDGDELALHVEPAQPEVGQYTIFRRTTARLVPYSGTQLLAVAPEREEGTVIPFVVEDGRVTALRMSGRIAAKID